MERNQISDRVATYVALLAIFGGFVFLAGPTKRDDGKPPLTVTAYETKRDEAGINRRVSEPRTFVVHDADAPPLEVVCELDGRRVSCADYDIDVVIERWNDE